MHISTIEPIIRTSGLYIGYQQLAIKTEIKNHAKARNLSISEIIHSIKPFLKKEFHAIYFQGEALLQAGALKNVLMRLKKLTRVPICLQTNGTFAKQFIQVRDFIDILEIDFHPDYVSETRATIQCITRSKTFVRYVIDNKSTLSAFERSIKKLAIKKDISFVIEPHNGFHSLFDFYTKATRYFSDVRVIPKVRMKL